MNRILKFLNINSDDNQKYILWSLFLKGLLITYISPCITKAIISDLPAEWLAFESLFGSISGLLIGILWKGNIRKTAIKSFLLFCITESLAGCFLGLYLCFINYNVWVFAICSLLYTSFITEFVAKCIMAFKAVLWQEKERELYDNNISIIGGIVCVIGFSLALLFMPSLKAALFIWALCCILDDIGWLIVYQKNKKQLKNIA